MISHPIYSLMAMGFLLMLSTSCRKDDCRGDLSGSKVYTTLDRTVIPASVPTLPVSILPYEIAKFSQLGYGAWYYGPGLPFQKRLDLMPSAYSNTTVTNTASLLHFFAMTDIHLTDKESPAQVLYMGLTANGNSSAYSPSMLYSTQVLDAAVSTVNGLIPTPALKMIRSRVPVMIIRTNFRLQDQWEPRSHPKLWPIRTAAHYRERNG